VIAGIGIDSVDIERFANWKQRPIEQLAKLFTKQEITYCLQNSEKTAERFAARFAVKEAFYKALSQILPNNNIPFLTACKTISVSHENNGNPIIEINWKFLLKNYPGTLKFNPKTRFKSLVSITHTKHVATAIVLIEHAI